MYRLIVESILGMHLEIDKLRFTPCLPAAWESFKVHYRYRETVYHITVMHSRTAHDEISVEIDGIKQHDDAIPLVDDRQTHFVEVRIPRHH